MSFKSAFTFTILEIHLFYEAITNSKKFFLIFSGVFHIPDLAL